MASPPRLYNYSLLPVQVGQRRDCRVSELDSPLLRYESTLHLTQCPYKSNQQPANHIQMMIFGREGYISPKQVTFQRAADVREVETVGVNYEHGSMYYIELFSLIKRPLALRDNRTRSDHEHHDQSAFWKYRMPCYRWLSTNRSDGAMYRMLWVHNERSRPALQSSAADELSASAGMSGVRPPFPRPPPPFRSS